jgi:hypothetical protein
MTPARQARGSVGPAPNGQDQHQYCYCGNIRLSDHRTIDERLGRPQAPAIRIAWSWRIDRGAGEHPSRIRDFCSSIEWMRCTLPPSPCLLPNLERGDTRPSRAGREARAQAVARVAGRIEPCGGHPIANNQGHRFAEKPIDRDSPVSIDGVKNRAVLDPWVEKPSLPPSESTAKPTTLSLAFVQNSSRLLPPSNEARS